MDRESLQNRLVEFAVLTVNTVIRHNKDENLKNLNDQVIRSSTSVALNYGEARSAGSKRDFVHKISTVLKELRETKVNLTIISRLSNKSIPDVFQRLIRENDELIAIFHRTLQTTRKNMDKIK